MKSWLFWWSLASAMLPLAQAQIPSAHEGLAHNEAAIREWAVSKANMRREMVSKHNPDQKRLVIEMTDLEMVAVVFVWNMFDGWVVAGSFEGSPDAPQSGSIDVTPGLGFQANNVLLALYSPWPESVTLPALHVTLGGHSVARQAGGGRTPKNVGMRGWYALAVEVRDGVRIIKPTQAHEHEVFNKLGAFNRELVARQLSTDAGRAMALGRSPSAEQPSSPRQEMAQLAVAAVLLMMFADTIMPSTPPRLPTDREVEAIYRETDAINQQMYFQWLGNRGY